VPLYRRALESRERVLGKEHPQTLSSVNNLALCLYALGDAAAALPLLRRALDSSEQVLGKEHPDTLDSVNNLAGCLRSLGDAAEALPLYRRAADGFDRLFGPDHPSARTVRANCDQLEYEVAGQTTRQTPRRRAKWDRGQNPNGGVVRVRLRPPTLNSQNDAEARSRWGEGRAEIS